MEIEVLGAEQYAALAKRLRDAADKGLQRELFAALNRGTKPAREKVLHDLPAYLPDVYAEELEPHLRLRTSRRASGIRITAKAKGPRGDRYVGPLEGGTLRKPLFGNRRRWFSQDVHPHFFSEPIKDTAPEIREQLVQAMENVAAQIAD
jgi:hypothetical protein